MIQKLAELMFGTMSCRLIPRNMTNHEFEVYFIKYTFETKSYGLELGQ